jgi:hypothetical protein
MKMRGLFAAVTAAVLCFTGPAFATTATFTANLASGTGYVQASGATYPPTDSYSTVSGADIYTTNETFGSFVRRNGLLRFATGTTLTGTTPTQARLSFCTGTYTLNVNSRVLTADWGPLDWPVDVSDYSATVLTGALASFDFYSACTGDQRCTVTFDNVTGIVTDATTQGGYTHIRLHISGGEPSGGSNQLHVATANGGCGSNADIKLEVDYTTNATNTPTVTNTAGGVSPTPTNTVPTSTPTITNTPTSTATASHTSTATQSPTAVPGGGLDSCIPTSNLVLAWSADTIAASNGQPILSWLDESPSGANLAQSTSAKAPIYTTSVANGHPSVNFAGPLSEQYMTTGLVSYRVNQLYVVYAKADGVWADYTGIMQTTNKTYCSNAPTSNDELGLLGIQGTNKVNGAGCGDRVLSPATAAWIDGVAQNITNFQDYSLGVDQGTATGVHVVSINYPNDTTGSKAWIVGKSAYGTSTRAFNGDLFMVLGYDGVHNVSTRTTVEQCIAGKYALTWAWTPTATPTGATPASTNTPTYTKTPAPTATETNGSPTTTPTATWTPTRTVTGGTPTTTPNPDNLTPLMGWLAWYGPNTSITDAYIRAMAKAFVDNGLDTVGYKTIAIDDGWCQDTRDVNGNLQPITEKFPDMAALATSLHSQGLKLGIYADRGGSHMCGSGCPGSEGYEITDARQFATWGIDNLKLDNCGGSVNTWQVDIAAWRNAIYVSGRPNLLLYIAHTGPTIETVAQFPQFGDYWLTGCNEGQYLDESGSCYIGSYPYQDWEHQELPLIDNNQMSRALARPGKFNDLDVILGSRIQGSWPYYNETELRSQMAMRAISASPLWLSGDINGYTPTMLAFLKNTEVIAVDQDSLGIQAYTLYNNGSNGVGHPRGYAFYKPLSDGSIAVVLLNRTSTPATINLTFADVGLTGSVLVRDLWAKADVGSFSGSYSATNVPAHDNVMLKLTGALYTPTPTRTPTQTPAVATPTPTTQTFPLPTSTPGALPPCVISSQPNCAIPAYSAPLSRTPGRAMFSFFGAPSMTTSQRDALQPSDGWMIYNEDTQRVEVRRNGAWVGASMDTQ